MTERRRGNNKTEFSVWWIKMPRDRALMMCHFWCGSLPIILIVRRGELWFDPRYRPSVANVSNDCGFLLELITEYNLAHRKGWLVTTSGDLYRQNHHYGPLQGLLGCWHIIESLWPSWAFPARSSNTKQSSQKYIKNVPKQKNPGFSNYEIDVPPPPHHHTLTCQELADAWIRWKHCQGDSWIVPVQKYCMGS